MNIRCLIVDDEPLALDIIASHISKIPFLTLEGKVESAIEALEIISTGQVDLLFLDIQMPELTGFELLESLSNKPMVIFTTAYPDFALDSYEVSAVDYLLKPVPFSRFLKAANKAKDRILLSETMPSASMQEESDNYIYVKSDYKSIKIHYSEILYIESVKDYVCFHCTDKKISSLLNIKTLEAKLPADKFMRVHRSFIVSLYKIDAVERNLVHIGKSLIAVGENYREQFLRSVNEKKIE